MKPLTQEQRRAVTETELSVEKVLLGEEGVHRLVLLIRGITHDFSIKHNEHVLDKKYQLFTVSTRASVKTKNASPRCAELGGLF